MTLLSPDDEPRWTRAGIPLLMLVAVMAVYTPFSAPADQTLFGIDYNHLHVHRIRFAQAALAEGRLPGWYPREFLGTPFWSNIQNFPFIPTRLVLLLFEAKNAYVIGVMLNASFAAFFTFLFVREIGFTRLAAAVAGWTFACTGEFAARVLAGHLVSLEGYPSLPLLLWLIERALRDQPALGDEPALKDDSSHRRRINWRLIALGAAMCCVALTPHPQFPFYSFVVSAAYIVYRTRKQIRRGVRLLAVMACGGGMAAFALLPMLLLIRRSTRVLDLDSAVNDVPFDYHRLLAFVRPWAHGWAGSVGREPTIPFTGGPNDAFFWDTVCYTGVLPVVCIIALVTVMFVRRKMFGPVGFLIFAGLIALLTAMPFVVNVLDQIPGTLLRSPARQAYVTVFALAIAIGFVVDRTARWYAAVPNRRHWAGALLFIGLGIHLVDVALHARAFVVTSKVLHDEQFAKRVRNAVGDGRVAMDYSIPLDINRAIDDAGVFDSILLATSYAGIMALDGQNPRLNIQDLLAADLSGRTLAALGVRLIVTRRIRPDYPNISHVQRLNIYRVPGPAPRAAFFPERDVSHLPSDQIYDRLRDKAYDPRAAMMLPTDADSTSATTNAASQPSGESRVEYERINSDEIELRVSAATPGYVRVLESWDPGWHATVDASPVEVLPADNMFLSVPVDAGTHVVRLQFKTPGALAGALVSVAFAAGLIAMSLRLRPTKAK